MTNAPGSPLFPSNPVRQGIPTPGGVFPISPNGGGLRRKRRPHLDLGLHDALTRIANQDDLMEFAFGIIANAYGGRWEDATPEWKAAAENWRDRFLDAKKSGALAATTQVIEEANRLPSPVVQPVADKPAAEGDSTLDAFMVRLSALPPSEAKKELPGWDGEDETFMEAAAGRWNELHPDPMDSEFGRWLQSLDRLTQLYFLGDERFAQLQAGKLDVRDLATTQRAIQLSAPDDSATAEIIRMAKNWEAAGSHRGPDGSFVTPKDRDGLKVVTREQAEELIETSPNGMLPEGYVIGTPLAENTLPPADGNADAGHQDDAPQDADVQEEKTAEQPALQAGDGSGSESPSAPPSDILPQPEAKVTGDEEPARPGSSPDQAGPPNQADKAETPGSGAGGGSADTSNNVPPPPPSRKGRAGNKSNK